MKIDKSKIALITFLLLTLAIGVVLVYIINSIALQIAVGIIWAVANLVFLRLQERWKKEVKTC